MWGNSYVDKAYWKGVARMTEKDIYSNGVALLEEWEDVNYCEHSFKFKDEWLTDKEVVDLLNELDEKYVDEFSLRETLQQELQRVETENEHIKQVIKEAYQTERTHIGRNVLKQLLNNIGETNE